MRFSSMILALLTAAPTATRAFTSSSSNHMHQCAKNKVFLPFLRSSKQQLCSSTRLFSSTAIAAEPKTKIGTPSTSFDDGTSPFEITTPIYYVNDKPHIGHAYTSLACDVIARYMRHSGRDVYFLSGTDEHGQKVETTAKNAGKDPQTFCDEVSQSFRELLTILNISNDEFIRTTQSNHKEAVQHFWNKLVDNGAIYLGSYEKTLAY